MSTDTPQRGAIERQLRVGLMVVQVVSALIVVYAVVIWMMEKKPA